MRELKFRAWDKKLKDYYYNAEYTYGFHCGGRECYADSFGDILAHPERYEVEQYTGLKDKNGREIYEGDIVKVFSTDEYVVSFEGVYRVYFDNNWLSYRMHKVQSSYSSIAEYFEPEMSTNIEVIGNIHENPELLGGEE